MDNKKLLSLMAGLKIPQEETIGERIKKERLKQGLTQKKLSELCGMAENRISQYETGYRNPSYKTLCKIAEVLNISYGELIFGDVVYHIDLFSDEMKDSISNHNYERWIYDSLIWFEEMNGENLDWMQDFDISQNASDSKYNNEKNIRTALKALVFYFFKLNPEGRKKLFERIEELLEMEKYTKK